MGAFRKAMTHRLWQTIPCGLLLFLTLVACACSVDSQQGLSDNITGRDKLGRPNVAQTDLHHGSALSDDESADLLDVALAKVPEVCNTTLWQCLALNPQAQQALQAKLYCNIISDPKAKQCLVNLGKCTEENFNDIKSVVCAGQQKSTALPDASNKASSPPTAVSATQAQQTTNQLNPRVSKTTTEPIDLLDVALAKVPEVCNATLWQCLALNPLAMQALQAKIYCEIMSTKEANACLVTLGKCTEGNFNDMKAIVCAGQENSTAKFTATSVAITTVPPFQSTISSPVDLLDVAIAKVPEACNATLWQCLALNPQAMQAVQAKMYCEIMSAPEAKACLVTLGKCTEGNFNDMKSVVCAGHQQTTPNSVTTTKVPSTPSTTTTVDLLDVAIAKVPEACNATLWQCLALNPQAQQAVQAKLYCDIMINPAAEACLVVLGKCTEDNFNDMKSVVCAGKQLPTSNSVASTKVPSTPSTTSTPVDLLDVAIAKVPEACNATLWQCLALNPKAQQAVQAKMYCDIMINPAARACLVTLGKCTEGNFNDMKSIVCAGQQQTTTPPAPTTAKVDLLDSALSKVSSDCNQTLWRCLNLNPQALDYLKEKQYCVVMASPQAQACLTVLGKCTQDEYLTMNDTVCENKATTTQPVDLLDVAIAKVPQACNQTLWQCLTLNPQAGQAMQEKKYCDIMSNPAARGCLVILGHCTEENFDDMKTIVCGGQQPTGAPPAATTKATGKPATTDGEDFLTVALTKVSKACSSTLWTCLDLNPEAKQAVEEKRYCEVMRNPMAKSCLVTLGSCKEEEFNKIQKTVCVVKKGEEPVRTTTPTPKPWVARQIRAMGRNALVEVVQLRTQKCQSSFWGCLQAMPQTLQLINNYHYCDAVKANAAMMCMVAMGDCTERDMDAIRGEVCQGVTFEPVQNLNAGSRSMGAGNSWGLKMALAVFVLVSYICWND